MRIALERSGGFAGVTLQSEVDTAELAPDEAREWERLVAAADLRSLGGGRGRRGRGAPGMRDAFQYDLTVEDGGRRTRVAAGEHELSEPARELVGRLVERARA